MSLDDFEIVCVDTWLGSEVHWGDRGKAGLFSSLRTQNGYPRLYFTFLRNVIDAGLIDIITPFPNTSMNAANLFAYQKFVFDVIYIDASHEYKNVRQDLEAWWPLLRPGGVMFGDDYIVGCPGVIRAACEWAEHVKGNLMLAAGGKWVLQKI